MSEFDKKFRWFLLGYSFKLFNGQNGNGTHISAIPVEDIQSNNIDNDDINLLTGWAKSGFIKKMAIEEQSVDSFFILSVSTLGDMTNNEFYKTNQEKPKPPLGKPFNFDLLDSHKEEIEHLTEMNKRYLGKMQEQQDQIAELKSKNNALHALCRMRGAVISAEKWSVLRPHIKKAIKCLDRKEKALRGES